MLLAVSLTMYRAYLTDLSSSPFVCLSAGLCLSAWKVYCGNTAEWIRMPFWMVCGVGRLRDGCIRWLSSKGKELLGVNLGRPIVTSGDFATRLFIRIN